MKKRLLSWLMVLTLCLTLLPTAALADTSEGEDISVQSSETHEHYLCGGNECACPDGKKEGEYKHTFTAWTDELAAEQWKSNEKTASNSLPRESSASYYLTKNVELEAEDSYSPWSGGGITLCLNGHSIRMKGNKSVISVSGTFTLVDCKGDKGKYGQITHASGSKGCGIRLTGGTFNMYGGNITGNNTSDGGSGVYMTGKSTFNMYGGQITDNSTTYCGGGVYSDYQSSSKCTINMYGGEISGNTADSDGGGVYNGNGTFTMCGGEITGNNCISGDYTKRGGGGVYVGGIMTVSGAAKITDNVRDGNLNTDTGKYTGGTANNVYLVSSNKTITIGGELTGEIGVTVPKKSKFPFTIATDADADTNYTGIIVSDDAGYEIKNDNGTLKLDIKSTPAPTEEHKHCICGETHTNVGDHTSESQTTFATKLWMDGDTLKMGDKEWKPTTTTVGSNNPSLHYVLSKGSYYLGSDIKLTESIHIQEGVQLCLNGFSIISDGTVTGRHVIIVEGSSLTLTDCKGSGKITHADKKNGGGVSVYNPSSVFNMFGGIITGNNIDGGVKNNGTFNMYGGEISGNTATSNGGGVYVGSYSWVSFKVSGSAKITDNTVNGAANNVYLPSGKTIAISGLTGGANIGVTTAEKPEGSKTVTIASSVGELNYENYVKADDSEKYEVKRSNGDLVLAAKNGSGTTPAKHEHYLCGGSESCTCPVKETKKVEFQPWAETNKLPNTAGNWYLTGNVTLENYWTPANNTVLDLNGYSITVNKNTEPEGWQVGAIVVKSGRTFTLVDCKGSKTEYGQITHGTNTETNSKYPGRGVCVYGTFNMYGGNITGNEVTQEWYCGGGVSVYAAAGIFNLYGGSITNNKSNNTSTASPCGEGGGVYTIGKFTMYDGTISGNEAYRDGGGVYTVGANGFTMYGGNITGNTARGQHYKDWYIGGGGVFVASGNRDDAGIRFTMKGGTISNNTAYGAGGGVYVEEYYGSFVMEGGTISGNRAVVENSKSYYAGEGGGVYVGSTSDCIFTMKNGSIIGNSAAKDGGGVYVTGRFTMSGGTIGGTEESAANTASGDGGGVYVYSSSSYVHACVMSGNATVTGNKKIDGTANNVWLPSNNRYIIISGELTGTHPIGVTMSDYPKNGWTIPITYTNTNYNYTVTEADKDKFTSDKEGYEIKYNEREKELRLAKESTPTPGKVDAGVKITTENANEQAPTEVVYGDTFKLGTTLKSTGTAGSPQSSDWTWTSSDPDVLSVTGSGSAATVKALKPGEATITVTYESEGAKGSATATIKVNRREISVKADNKNMTVGGELPAFTVIYGNFVSGDTADTVLATQPVPTTTADGKTVGTFDITVEAPTLKSSYADKYTVGAPQKGTLTVNAVSTPSTPSTPSSGSSSGSSTTTKTETTTNPDGSVTKTETRSDGTVIETTTNPDGSTSKTESKTTTKSNGSTVETVTETNTGADGSKSTSKTETTTAKDGSKTETKSETKTEADGTKSETKSETKTDANGVTSGTETTKTTAPNGSTGTTTTTTENGNTKTEAEAKVSEKAIEDAKKSGEAVKVPTEVKAGENSDSAPTVKVELPKNAGETKIEIPVSDVNSGTVAVIVHPDGTEEIVKDSKPTADGVELTVDGSATVKVIDNSKDFIDTRNHWSRDEVNFVASREIFNGVGGNLFGVGQPMTRGMVNTVLARLAGIDTTPENGQKWYEVGTEWAKANGITDGTNPEASVTREQLATLLYRFCGTPEVSGVLSFADAGEVSDYAQSALLWATQNDILNGVGNNRVAPNADAQRAQVAAMMARYLKNVG